MTIKKQELTVGLTTPDEDFFWYTTAVNVKRFQRIFFDLTNPSFLSRQKPPRLRYSHPRFFIKPFSLISFHSLSHSCVLIILIIYVYLSSFFVSFFSSVSFLFLHLFSVVLLLFSLVFFLTLFMLRPHNEVLN